VRGTGWIPIGRGWLPEVHVASLPQGKDPADFVRAEGAEGVARVLEGAVPLVEFLLHRALDGAELGTPDGRARAVRRGVEVLRHVGDSLLRHEYALWLADRAGIEPYEVTRALDAAPAIPLRPARSPERVAMSLSGPHRVEREALRAVLAHPKLMGDPQLAPEEEDFTLPVHRALFRLAGAEFAERGTFDPGRLAERIQDAELRSLASELSVGDQPEGRVARDTLARLKVFTIERHIVERKGRLRSLDPDKDGPTYDALFEELLELEKRRRALVTPG
jgi:DNA primase